MAKKQRQGLLRRWLQELADGRERLSKACKRVQKGIPKYFPIGIVDNFFFLWGGGVG